MSWLRWGLGGVSAGVVVVVGVLLMRLKQKLAPLDLYKGFEQREVSVEWQGRQVLTSYYTRRNQDTAPAVAVVYIHGAGASGAHWCGGGIGEALLRHLPAEHAVIIPNLFGHGWAASPLSKHPEAYSMASHADHVAQVIHHEKVQSVVLVGHSMGSVVGLLTARALRGVRVRGVVYVEGNLDEGDAFATGRMAQPGPKGTMYRGLAWLAQYMGIIASAEAFIKSSRDLSRLSNSGKLLGMIEELKVPVLFMYGEHSAQYFNFTSLAMLLAHKDHRDKVVVIKGAGHGMHHDQPDLVFGAIRQFLDREAPLAA